LGGNYKEKLHPWYLATPLWPWHNMGKEAKKKSEGSRVQIQVSSDICVLLLWTIIKRPLVLHIASVISPGLLLLLYGHDWKRVVKNIEVKKEILGIFRACCWSVLYYGKSEGQWARCLKIGRNLGQIYWSWRSWTPPPTSRAKSIKKSRQNSSFSIQWNGQDPRKTNQIEQNTGTKISLSSKISLKVFLGFAFRA